MDFYLNWTDYKNGFGNHEGEHWLGLDNMYLLTNLSGVPPQLRVDLADWEGNTAFAKYDQFSVGDEDSDYTLSVSGYQSASTAGDSLAFQNGQSFSTPDRDNDASDMTSSVLCCTMDLGGTTCVTTASCLACTSQVEDEGPCHHTVLIGVAGWAAFPCVLLR